MIDSLFTFVDLGAVETVEDGVEHDLGVVAVRVELGAEAVGVGDDPGVLADDRVGGRLGDLDATLGHPGSVKKVVLAAEGLVVGRGGVKTCEERIRKVTMVRFHIQAGEKYLNHGIKGVRTRRFACGANGTILEYQQSLCMARGILI